MANFDLRHYEKQVKRAQARNESVPFLCFDEFTLNVFSSFYSHFDQPHQLQVTQLPSGRRVW